VGIAQKTPLLLFMKLVFKILSAIVFLYPFVLGYFLGNTVATEKLRNQAVAAGAGEFITTSTNGEKKFLFVTPNCGPH
jgi:hypothetical protein